jgi:hypothetical protein
MPEPGRNDPCPCGSGKKYKKCCLARRQEDDRATHHRDRAVSIALDWLVRHHEEAVDRAVEEGFLASYGPGSLDLVRQLRAEDRSAVFSNAREWLVAEGTLDLDGEEVSALGLFLDHAGEALTEEQRRWLLALAEQPLDLYGVEEVLPGEGLRLVPVLPEGESGEPFLVHESRSLPFLQPDDTVGLRVVPWEGGHRLSEALYRLDTEWLQEALSREEGEDEQPAAEAAAGEDGGDEDLDEGFEPTVGEMVIDLWLDQLVGPLAEEVGWFDEEDAGAVIVVADRYEVRDEAALRAALAEAGAEARGESGWVLPQSGEDREEDSGGSVDLVLKPATAQDPGPILEVTAPSPELADWIQDELLERAGAALRFLERSSEDLATMAAWEAAEEIDEDVPAELAGEVTEAPKDAV